MNTLNRLEQIVETFAGASENEYPTFFSAMEAVFQKASNEKRGEAFMEAGLQLMERESFDLALAAFEKSAEYYEKAGNQSDKASSIAIGASVYLKKKRVR